MLTSFSTISKSKRILGDGISWDCDNLTTHAVGDDHYMTLCGFAVRGEEKGWFKMWSERDVTCKLCAKKLAKLGEG